jgi:tetratricopeptide (TPR) repeat protein
MKFLSLRRARFAGAALLLSLIAGCATPETTVSSTNRDVKRELAAAFLTAQGFDRAQIAIRRDNQIALQNANADLRRVAGSSDGALVSLAAPLARDAAMLELLAARSSGSEKGQLRAQSTQKYRAALAFLPSDARERDIIEGEKLDPETLNSLGYFLASRGESRADFERAVRLTRAALAGYDKILQSFSSTSPQHAALEFARAQGPQDSYAWALFKVGRLNEARKQQEQVMATLTRLSNQGPISADIPFHLAEIQRALGDREGAIEAYAQAMKLAPDEEVRVQIEAALQALGVLTAPGGKVI